MIEVIWTVLGIVFVVLWAIFRVSEIEAQSAQGDALEAIADAAVAIAEHLDEPDPNAIDKNGFAKYFARSVGVEDGDKFEAAIRIADAPKDFAGREL